MNEPLPWLLAIVLSLVVLGQTLYILHEHASKMIIHLHADSVQRQCTLGFAIETNFLGQISTTDGFGNPLHCDERAELAPRVWVECYCPRSDDPK